MVTLALGLLAAPLPTAAQPAEKVYRIGMLSSGSAASGAASGNMEAFRHGLRALGYVEGQNLSLAWRSAEGQVEHLPTLAAELVGLPVDVLVAAGGTPVALAAQRATTTIPIVMTNVGNPVETGLVASLARPGGNITGLSSMSPDITGKRLELLKEVVPALSRVAVLWNPANPSAALTRSSTLSVPPGGLARSWCWGILSSRGTAPRSPRWRRGTACPGCMSFGSSSRLGA
jgi:putative ABC transport system substrate-binding protein